MIKKVLVPIDGSETARKALKYAIDLAKQMRSTVILLSVIDQSAQFGSHIRTALCACGALYSAQLYQKFHVLIPKR
jgi:hypothetical protein